MIDCNRGAQAKLRAGEAGEGDVFLVVFVFLFFLVGHVFVLPYRTGGAP